MGAGSHHGEGGTDDLANLQTICKRCHANKTALESARGRTGVSVRPDWLPVPRIPVLVVCGPAGSGKSTYVRDHLQAGELVLDVDELAAELTGKPLYHSTFDERMAAIRLRNRRLPDQTDPASAGARTGPSAEQLAKDREQREQARAAEAARYRERADDAARVAMRMWDEAAEVGACSYLTRKGVQGHGVRYLADGTLLVPMHTAAGELQNLQRIAPEKPADGKPEKRFLSGGRKSGLLHWCGDPADAPLLLIAEGYATAASLHEATGRPVAVTCTDRVGWHGPVYVLPSGSIGATEGRRYVFQSESGMEDTFRRLGTLADWQSSVAALCAGNSRMVFAVCCAFAGPLLRLAGMESGGFHFRGVSSMGKTTALKVAASVWGRPSYMQRWRTTDNALEATAVQHCDGLLILDEFGQLDPRVAGECAYMLANDQEKGRATRGGLARKRRTWRVLFLSSGEVSLADHMAEAGKRTRAGMEVRMVDVPLDAGGGMGGVENVHGLPGAADLADAIVGAAARQYGTAGRAWLEWACVQHAQLPERLVSLVERYRAQVVPESASEQVRRVGSRFALVAAAGELATEAGITGWTAGEAVRAASRCFNAWLGARGHMDNGEDASMLRQVRRFLELNGEGRFTWWHRAMDDHTPKTLNRAGFRRLLGDDGKPVKSDADHQREYGERISAADAERAQVEYVVLREVFQREVCLGFDAAAVAKLLQRRGHLVHETDRLTVKHRLPGIGKAACYHLKPSIFDDEL